MEGLGVRGTRITFESYVLFLLFRKKGKTLNMDKMLPRKYYDKKIEGNRN